MMTFKLIFKSIYEAIIEARKAKAKRIVHGS